MISSLFHILLWQHIMIISHSPLFFVCIFYTSGWVMHCNTRGNGIKFHRGNTKSLLSLDSLSADSIIDNVNKEPGSFSTSFVTGCLHNVHFCFSCDFLDVTQKPRTGMQRSRCRHKHTHTYMCSSAQRSTGHAWVCTNRGCLSLSGTSVR